jgi:hypothetical protein
VKVRVDLADPARFGNKQAQLGARDIDIDDMPESGGHDSFRDSGLISGRGEYHTTAARICIQHCSVQLWNCTCERLWRNVISGVDFHVVRADRVRVAQGAARASPHTEFSSSAGRVIKPQPHMVRALIELSPPRPESQGGQCGRIHR